MSSYQQIRIYLSYDKSLRVKFLSPEGRMTCSSCVNGFEWGKSVFHKQWWRMYIHPLKCMVFCRKNGPPEVTLPLVNLKCFWLNLNLSRDLLISLGILSQNNHPFRFCVSRQCYANILMRLDQLVLRTRSSLHYMDMIWFGFGLADLIPWTKS